MLGFVVWNGAEGRASTPLDTPTPAWAFNPKKLPPIFENLSSCALLPANPPAGPLPPAADLANLEADPRPTLRASMSNPIALIYKYHMDIPADIWRWPNFSPSEIACRHCGEIIVNFEALDKLQELRTNCGAPLHINSGYRCAWYNKSIGGSPTSYHLRGEAFDIRNLEGTENLEHPMLIEHAKVAGFTGLGTYKTKQFVHVDIGPLRTWSL